MSKRNHSGRSHILASALKVFAERGYSGSSLQDIVSAAHLTKPTLYYYFKSKEGLFNELLESGYDECFARMQAAVSDATSVEEQLIETLVAVFDFFRERMDLARLAFAAAFAAPGEMPVKFEIREKRRRNFEFVHALVKRGIESGALGTHLKSRDLANGIFGAMSFHVMANLLMPGITLNRATAEKIVSLFMDGARAHTKHTKK